MASGFSSLVRRAHTEIPGGFEYEKHTDDRIAWSWDWSNECGSDALASAAYVDSGVVRAGAALVGNATSCDVSGVGSFELAVTTAAGRIYKKTFRFVEPDGGREDDYGS